MSLSLNLDELLSLFFMSFPFIMETVKKLIIDDKLAYGRTNLFFGLKWYAAYAMILFLITKYPFLSAFQDNLPNLATSSLFMFYQMPILLFSICYIENKFLL